MKANSEQNDHHTRRLRVSLWKPTVTILNGMRRMVSDTFGYPQFLEIETVREDIVFL
jgi:hypothetical protein